MQRCLMSTAPLLPFERRRAERFDAGELSQNEYLLEILDAELKLTLRGLELESRRDEAMTGMVRSAAAQYDGRVVRELIQNAYDGPERNEDARILVRLDLRRGDGLLDVANSGEGFLRKNVDAIVNPSLSSKRPGNSVGHKGLGFRGVDTVSSDPQVYSVSGLGRRGGTFDGFCFRFADEDTQLARLRTLAPPAFAAEAVGLVHRMQLPIPISDAEGAASAAEYARLGYATLVRLPLIAGKAAAIDAELGELFDERAPLALFLNRLSELVIECVRADGTLESRTISRKRRSYPGVDTVELLKLDEVETDGHRYLVARRSIPKPRFEDAVRRAVEAQYRVERWLDWEGEPEVSVAFPLGTEMEGRYCAFLPMEMASPFPGFLDGPFFPDPDRTSVSLRNPLNDMIVDFAAEICVALASGLAAQEATALDLVGAAVDALAWRDHRDRVLAAAEASLGECGALLLPTMRRPDGGARWGRLDEVFDWDDAAHVSIKASWISKACGVPFIRRNLGSARMRLLADLADQAELTLAAWPQKVAEWIPDLAADLLRRRKLSLAAWEAFYRDLTGMPDVLALLKGKAIFRNSEGRLVEANGGTGGSQFFISPDGAAPAAGPRRRRRLAGTDVHPPASLTRGLQFADQSLSWPPDVVAGLVGAGLAEVFSLPQLLSKIGRILGPTPRKAKALLALRWAFDAWSANRLPEVEKALALAGLRVPAGDETYHSAGEMRFARGWRDTQGDLLADFCDGAAAVSRTVAQVRRSLLPSWEEWPLRERGSAQDWAAFLKHAGVKDGLPALKIADEEHGPWTWRSFRSGTADKLAAERTAGPHWREAIRGSPNVPQYGSGLYSTDGSLWFLPGQAVYDRLPPAARLAFSRNVLRYLTDAPAGHFSTVLQKRIGYYDRVNWPSPLLAFLQAEEWLPLSAADDFEGVSPGRCWHVPRGEALPRFVRRLDRSARELIDGSEPLRKVMVERLGLRMWTDAASAGARVVELGEMLEAGVPEPDHDSFRKAYREAWEQWAAAPDRAALPDSLVIAVDRGGRLAPLHVAPSDADRGRIHVGDGSNALVEQLLAALGMPVLQVPEPAAAAVVEGLRAAVGGDVGLVEPGSMAVEIDGRPFTADPSLPELVVSGREWLAELSVLVLELNSPLTSRNTAQSRQAIHDAVRRVRIAWAARIEVEVGGAKGELPLALQGVLPVSDPELPTLVVRGTAGELDWPTLVRMAGPLALAIGRPALGDAFRLAFLALQAASRGTDLERPTDDMVAAALGRPVSRIRELYRSLRSTNARLLELLAPAVWIRGGADLARSLCDAAETLVEEADVVAFLTHGGMGAQPSSELVNACRDAEGLNELRATLGVGVSEMNAALTGLGHPWRPLDFSERLRRAFRDRVAERRRELEERVRDAHADAYDRGDALTAYLADLKLDWLQMPDAWGADRDDLEEAAVDAEIDRQLAARVPAGAGRGDDAVEDLRQANRADLAVALDCLRRLARAWCAKHKAALPAGLSAPSEQLVRQVVGSGALDFRRLNDDGLAGAMSKAGFWPAGMPLSMNLDRLQLIEEDLRSEEREETKRREDELRSKRTIMFGSTPVDGGQERCLDEVAQLFAASLQSGDFRGRSGVAQLEAFSGRPTTGGGGGRTGGPEPTYSSDEQRLLVGFAGELAAYHYLKRHVRGFSDACWISSIGRRFLGEGTSEDDAGYDFRVPRFRGAACYEVKTHSGDPGTVDLERSQLLAAMSMAEERGSSKWRILYVSNARNPSLIAVHELPNPFSTAGAPLFREVHRNGVRLAVRRR